MSGHLDFGMPDNPLPAHNIAINLHRDSVTDHPQPEGSVRVARGSSSEAGSYQGRSLSAISPFQNGQ